MNTLGFSCSFYFALNMVVDSLMPLCIFWWKQQCSFCFFKSLSSASVSALWPACGVKFDYTQSLHRTLCAFSRYEKKYCTITSCWSNGQVQRPCRGCMFSSRATFLDDAIARNRTQANLHLPSFFFSILFFPFLIFFFPPFSFFQFL